jgi:hypothetical protein
VVLHVGKVAETPVPSLGWLSIVRLPPSAATLSCMQIVPVRQHRLELAPPGFQLAVPFDAVPRKNCQQQADDRGGSHDDPRRRPPPGGNLRTSIGWPAQKEQ